MTADASHHELATHLGSVTGETLRDDTDWTIAKTADGCEVVLPDERIRIDRYHSPDESVRWELTLQADGDIVGKSGPYESIATVGKRLQTLLTSEVRYTVCCDG